MSVRIKYVYNKIKLKNLVETVSNEAVFAVYLF
jgi:hypothetical protein